MKTKLFLTVTLFVLSFGVNALTQKQISVPRTYISTCVSPYTGYSINRPFNIKINISAAKYSSSLTENGSTLSTATVVIPKAAKISYILQAKSKLDFFTNQFSILNNYVVPVFNETYDVETKYTTSVKDFLSFRDGNVLIKMPTPYVTAAQKTPYWTATSGKNRVKIVGKVIGNRFNGYLLFYRLLKKDANFFYYKNYLTNCK
jgi:hypothetical protein